LVIVLDTLQARRLLEANPALRPFLELGGNIFRDKNNLRGPANQLVLQGIGLGNHKSKDRAAIRRGHGYPAVTGLEPGIKGQMEPELIEVKSQAAILIANEYVYAVNAKVWVHWGRRREATHGRDYKSESYLFGCSPMDFMRSRAGVQS
jgi:hypothetical protein